MWLLAMKGLSGCGKSTLSRALSRQLGWPLIDKDDIRDLLDDGIPAAGPLAYDIMFHVARRQLLQGMSVICDSPLTGTRGYEHAQEIAHEAHASLAILECTCSDHVLWQQRIEGRQHLQLPAHHQTNWDAFQPLAHSLSLLDERPIVHPHLIIDTVTPLHECLAQVMAWLERLQQSPCEDARIGYEQESI